MGKQFATNLFLVPFSRLIISRARQISRVLRARHRDTRVDGARVDLTRVDLLDRAEPLGLFGSRLLGAGG
jgi:hypothetical protein